MPSPGMNVCRECGNEWICTLGRSAGCPVCLYQHVAALLAACKATVESCGCEDGLEVVPHGDEVGDWHHEPCSRCGPARTAIAQAEGRDPS